MSTASRADLEALDDRLCVRLTGLSAGMKRGALDNPNDELEVALTARARRASHPARVAFDTTARAGQNRPAIIPQGKSREVVLKVLSSASSSGGLARHVRYITRDGALEFLDAEAAKRPGDEWRSFVDEVAGADPSKRKNRGLTVHLVVSLPANTPIETETLDALTDEWMEALAPGHQRLIVVHRDTAHPHAHVVVARHGPDKRFRFAARDFQPARAAFVERAAAHGVELTATRRRTTGRPRRESQSRRKHEKAKRQGRTARREAPQSEREREWGARTLEDLEALVAVRREKMQHAGAEAPGEREAFTLASAQHRRARRAARELARERDYEWER